MKLSSCENSKRKHSNSNSDNSQPHSDFQTKFKTELCRNYERALCPFGKTCTFAHGLSELKLKTHISVKYKTKHCEKFYNIGYCSYGHRCQFIHADSRSTSPSPTSERAPRRLPVFLLLSKTSNSLN